MDDNLKLSIITVSLNSAEYIEETILSVLNQDYPDFEYIIIDGGSTDGTLDIIEKYKQQLTYFCSEPDNGLYDAMNKGIKRATGDIVGIINSDDYYFPGTFSTVNKAFKGKSLDSHIFWGDVEYEIKGTVKGFRPQKTKIGAFAPHPSMFCPRKIYERIGLYDTSFRLLGDYDFMYRAINKNKINPIYVPVPIAFFREGGLADSNIKRCLKDELTVKLKYGQSIFLAYPVYWLKLFKNYKRFNQ